MTVTTAGVEALVDELVRAARGAGERVLLRDGARTMRGDEIAEALERLPQALAERGMRPGQVVLLGVRPGIDALLLLLATLRAGALTTFLDPGAGEEAAGDRFGLPAPDWVIAESILYLAAAPTPLRGYLRRRGLRLPPLGRLPGQHVRVGRRLPFVPRSTSLDELRGAASPGAVPELRSGLDPDAAALVMTTSGSAGEARGAQHTGRSMAATIRRLGELVDLPPDAVLRHHDPRWSMVGILAGVPTVVEPVGSGAARFVADVEAHAVTHAVSPSSAADALVRHLERAGRRLPTALRAIVFQGPPVAPSVLDRLHALAHPELRVTCVYALTEAAPVACIDSRDACAWRGDGAVVGTVCPGITWRLDERGELHVTGDVVHRGYAGIDGARVEWLATGELARVDGDGNLVLAGRVGDVATALGA